MDRESKMKNKDYVAEEMAKVGYEGHFENKWKDLPPNSIDRAIWILVAHRMLNRFQELWELEKKKSIRL